MAYWFCESQHLEDGSVSHICRAWTPAARCCCELLALLCRDVMLSVAALLGATALIYLYTNRRQ